MQRALSADDGADRGFRPHELGALVGLPPHELLAKLASDLRKPDGLVMFTADDLPHALFGLQLRDIAGIGAKMEARLARACRDAPTSARTAVLACSDPPEGHARLEATTAVGAFDRLADAVLRWGVHRAARMVVATDADAVAPGATIVNAGPFGPVAVVYRVSSEDDAVALANDSDYGLGGAVFSADTARARAVASRLEVGMANVNTPAGEGAELPFGGVKRSGFGRELGPLDHHGAVVVGGEGEPPGLGPAPHGVVADAEQVGRLTDLVRRHGARVAASADIPTV